MKGIPASIFYEVFPFDWAEMQVFPGGADIQAATQLRHRQRRRSGVAAAAASFLAVYDPNIAQCSADANQIFLQVCLFVC